MLKSLVWSLVVLFATKFPQSHGSPPLLVKLEVKNARVFTMASGQREPFIGYLLVAEDGTLLDVQQGDPPSAASSLGYPRFHFSP